MEGRAAEGIRGTQSEIHHKSDLDHRRSGEKPLRVESDASDFATGAVLSMKCEDDKWRPCAFYSKIIE